MASAVDSRLAYARLSAVATASRLPTANRGSNNSYTTSWDTTQQIFLMPTPLLILTRINPRDFPPCLTQDFLGGNPGPHRYAIREIGKPEMAIHLPQPIGCRFRKVTEPLFASG